MASFFAEHRSSNLSRIQHMERTGNTQWVVINCSEYWEVIAFHIVSTTHTVYDSEILVIIFIAITLFLLLPQQLFLPTKSVGTPLALWTIRCFKKTRLKQ